MKKRSLKWSLKPKCHLPLYDAQIKRIVVASLTGTATSRGNRKIAAAIKRIAACYTIFVCTCVAARSVGQVKNYCLHVLIVLFVVWIFTLPHFNPPFLVTTTAKTPWPTAAVLACSSTIWHIFSYFCMGVCLNYEKKIILLQSCFGVWN